MSPWFSAAASGPALAVRHGLGPGAQAWLTGAVQLGFVAGTLTAAILNLADIVPARWYFGISALLAAASNLVLLVAPDYAVLVGARAATGFFLAGVYPPAMKMAATWFRERRGMAIGTVVGALTLGKAAPFLLFEGDAGLESLAGTGGVVAASVAALVGGCMVLVAWRDGPHAFPRRAFRWGLVGEVLRDRPTRLATWGYLGHMWELYAFWSVTALFLVAHRGAQIGAGAAEAGVRAEGGAWLLPGLDGVPVGVLAFLVIGSGAVGAVGAGVLADRLGRERVASWAMAASGALALGVGWLVAAPSWIVVPLLVAWGVTVVADSAQFSALVTEVAPPHAAGTALTLQTSLGFALTTLPIWAVPVLAGSVGWGWAFAFLAPGPAVGIVAMRALARIRSTPAGAPSPATIPGSGARGGD
ncbi:MAG: MFS transporter [Gemmatimonadales bacterium]|nr:MAG: MFS transporter [Gemmatimonadales bacterium]